MDDDTQPDAPEDFSSPPEAKKRDPTRPARKARWRKKHPAKAYAALAKWRAKKAAHYRDYQRRYMAERRAKARQSSPDT